MKIIKYFFEFITIISLFSIFKIIGLKNASNLGSIIGKFIGPLFRSKRITEQNIKIGLGELDKKKESEIINDMWSNIGRTFAEYVFLKEFKLNKIKDKNSILLTTEKDYFRISENHKKNIKYLKIKVEIENKNQFIENIKKII